MGTRISIVIMAAIMAVFTLDLVFGNAAAPPAAKTGAPGEQTCATQCHAGTAVNGGPGSVSIVFNGGNNTYVPGQTYPVVVSVADPNMTRFGFQITALTGGTGASVGTFTLTNTANTSTMLGNVGGIRRYVGQKNADTTKTWSFDWTAPSTATAPITFYASGNATNHNFGSSGDRVYTTTLTIDLFVGVSDQLSKALKVGPVPAFDYLQVEAELPIGGAELSIMDLSGRILSSSRMNNQMHLVDLAGLDPGVYFLQVKSGEGIATRKFLKG